MIVLNAYFYSADGEVSFASANKTVQQMQLKEQEIKSLHMQLQQLQVFLNVQFLLFFFVVIKFLSIGVADSSPSGSRFFER